MGITAKEFEQMKARVSGGKVRSPSRVLEQTTARGASRHQIVLGIDPSLRGTGYGIIRLSKPHATALSHGTVSCPASWERSRCLAKIAAALREQIAHYKPTVCVLEGLFFAQNLQTALIMGEARGASIVAAGEAGLEVFEISPRKMKQAIVGYGAAQKTAVAKMVQRMLRLAELPESDAADALGLALTYAEESSRYSFAQPKQI